MAVLKEIQKVIGDVEAVALCPRCEGSGKVWSELDFGDIPGDEVVFMQVGYRGLKRGTISNISNQKVMISHERFNIGGIRSQQFHNQVIKIVKEK